MKIIVLSNITLDGVMQAPGRPDEDRRGDFEHGGWAAEYQDSVMLEVAGKSMAQTGGILFGRRTYEDFFSVWPKRADNPFTEVLNQAPKYVVSRTLEEPLPWSNSTLLKGDASDTVAELKQKPGRSLVTFGGGELVQSLMREGLVDEYVLQIHPLVFGTGRRMFAEDGHCAKLHLIESTTTTRGVIIATYRPTAA